jgi:hypothetical protein
MEKKQFTPELLEMLDGLERELKHIRMHNPNRVNTLLKNKCFSLQRKVKCPYIKRILQSICNTPLSVTKFEEIQTLRREVESGEVELSVHVV